MKISKMTPEELVAAEKCANVVRKNYEDKIIMYRGIDYDSGLTETEKKTYSELSQKLARVNAIRLKIISEMETRLLSIDKDD